MPIKDGISASRDIRELEKTEPQRPRVTIFALPADAVTGTREMCLQHGMDGYLSKPVSLQQLRGVLDDLAQRSVNPNTRTSEHPKQDVL